jgi:hypothetical protein
MAMNRAFNIRTQICLDLECILILDVRYYLDVYCNCYIFLLTNPNWGWWLLCTAHSATQVPNYRNIVSILKPDTRYPETFDNLKKLSPVIKRLAPLFISAVQLSNVHLITGLHNKNQPHDIWMAKLVRFV